MSRSGNKQMGDLQEDNYIDQYRNTNIAVWFDSENIQSNVFCKTYWFVNPCRVDNQQWLKEKGANVSLS